jgi:hypothetical protein
MMSRRTTLTVLAMAALGAVTPLIAHAIGGRCWIYLPAHVPPLLAGLAFGPLAGMATGGAAALADLFWGGRVHGLAFLPIGLELVVYGTAAGALSTPRASYARYLVALLGAMLAGRLVYLVTGVALGRHVGQMLRGLFVTPWPGIALQLLLLPLAAPILGGATRRR